MLPERWLYSFIRDTSCSVLNVLSTRIHEYKSDCFQGHLPYKSTINCCYEQGHLMNALFVMDQKLFSTVFHGWLGDGYIYIYIYIVREREILKFLQVNGQQYYGSNIT
ncbi:uncharacterized protein LOC131041930 isoform X2 [Cryptomeria japonica]|uniref:uncharacterized protein LOC131041930 isoform X2 n=1 Tax=Cryptomeria japonica TaxID=3369 RepID=UPI0025AC8F58|nr:uncharacterized protein LOC131041930 isoform X2 [Cryptomeria japonica]